MISTNELSRSQILAVQQAHDKVALNSTSTDPSSMHNNLHNAFQPKKVQAASANVDCSPNDLNHNGLTKQEGTVSGDEQFSNK